MLVFKRVFVRGLLFKGFGKALLRQLYIKLTKFTRRASGAKSLLPKFGAGYQFLKDMSAYNWEVIKRCRHCMKRLTAENVSAVLVYGEKDIVEVLSDLTIEAPVRMRILLERYEADEKCGGEAVSVEVGASSSEKIIVASLVNTQERIKRLRELGVDKERIILLE